MSYEVHQLGQSFAREIVGIRLWETQSDGVIDELRSLWAAHGVLVFRRQALGENEFADFSARFGTLERIVRTEWASPVRPEVAYISNLRDGQGNAIGGLGDQEVDWHADQTYMLNPATGSMLYAVEIAHRGGTTSWANLADAYDALPASLKRAVEGKRAIFSYAKRLGGYNAADQKISEETRSKTPNVVHSILHVGPANGRRALYLDPTTTIGIVGMDTSAALALFDELHAFVTQPRFVYEHRWQVGDVVMWDNGFLLHRREPFPPSERRLLKRTTIVLPRAHHIVPDGTLAAAA